MALQLDFTFNVYLTVHLSPTSPYLSDPQSLHAIHPMLTHVGPVGVLRDVQIVSVPKQEWQDVSGDILTSLSDKIGVLKVEVQEDPKRRSKRTGDEL